MTERLLTLDCPYNPAMASEPKPAPRKVRCVINGEQIDVWEGYRLWDAALDADAKLWHICGGLGHCTTCAVIPVSGAENLTPPNPEETYKEIEAPHRLSCQARLLGDVVVKVAKID